VKYRLYDENGTEVATETGSVPAEAVASYLEGELGHDTEVIADCAIADYDRPWGPEKVYRASTTNGEAFVTIYSAERDETHASLDGYTEEDIRELELSDELRDLAQCGCLFPEDGADIYQEAAALRRRLPEVDWMGPGSLSIWHGGVTVTVTTDKQPRDADDHVELTFKAYAISLLLGAEEGGDQ
jgi:hypothetical protein